MRTLLIDTKDLIGVVERNTPCTYDEFKLHLQQSETMIVLTYTNVSEFAASLRASSDLLHFRALLQKIEQLPHVYGREVEVQLTELRACCEAFVAGKEPVFMSPFVQRWDATFAKFGEDPPAGVLVNQTIFDLVFLLHRTGIDFSDQSREQRVISVIEDERAIPYAKRPTPKEAFRSMIGKSLALYNVTFKGNVLDLADWIYEKSERSPSRRLEFEVFRSFVSNTGHKATASDVGDFAQLRLLPYVTAATCDKRIAEYVKQASAKIGVPYDGTIFKTLAAYLAAGP